MTRLTAIVLTYNEGDHIADCLATLSFADERVVFDSYSTDDTVMLARDNGARVIRHEFENFPAQRNAALTAVSTTTDWILFVDADERVSPELAEEIRLSITQAENAAYRIPRHNYLFGKLTRGAGWYPDYQTRLLKTGRAQYDPQKIVHEIVQVDGSVGTLDQPLTHYNYRDVTQFRAKQRKYLAFDVQQLYEAGVRPKVYSPFTGALRHFYWRFVTLNGYQDGWHGLRLSAMMAAYEFRKLALVRRKWHAT